MASGCVGRCCFVTVTLPRGAVGRGRGATNGVTSPWSGQGVALGIGAPSQPPPRRTAVFSGWRMIEKPSFTPSSGGAAVLERPTVADTPTTKRKVDPGKKYKLLLFNDDFNTRDHVTQALLRRIPGLSRADARAIMHKAHTTGMAVVGIWVFELAEAYCDLLRGEGLVSDIEPSD